jgi:hypothetical protein
MKRPKRQPPSDLPKGTISFGGPIEWFSIALIVRTETLSLERIGDLLDCAPTKAQRKDEPLLRPDGTVMRIPKFSSWRLKLTPSETDEWDPCEAAKLLLGRLNSNLEAWREIAQAGEMRLSFGLSMDASNRGFSLDAELVRYLADRGIQADFDIYTDDFDLPSEFPVPEADQTTH